MSRATLITLLGLLACGLISAPAQSPSPAMIVVQAADATTAPTAKGAATTATSAPDLGSIREALKALEEIKAANDEMLKKQEAALSQLDDMQKAADQLRIFAHRTGG